MSNAAIYARYSSGHQREESIEGQIRECTDFAKRNGLTIVEHYIDRAISAKTDDRPSFQQMVADSSKKTFDTIIVYTLDRFARNRYDSAVYGRILFGRACTKSKARYDRKCVSLPLGFR